jgi:hypothetical protein
MVRMYEEEIGTGEAYSFTCRWRQQVPPKRRYKTKRLNGLASQTFIIFIIKLFAEGFYGILYQRN